jgi:hypothetical protein
MSNFFHITQWRTTAEKAIQKQGKNMNIFRGKIKNIGGTIWSVHVLILIKIKST